MNFTTLYILCVASLGYLVTDIYLPALAIIVKVFNSSEGCSQLTFFSYMLSFSIGPLLLGPISEKIGRKKVILSGFIISIIATICIMLAHNMVDIILLRFLQGLGLGAAMIAGRASMSDVYRGREFIKQISYITMLMPLVLSIAPVLGRYLQENYGWKSIFSFLTISLLGMMIFYLVWLMPLLHVLNF